MEKCLSPIGCLKGDVVQKNAQSEQDAEYSLAIKTALVVDDSRLQRRIASALLSKLGLDVLEAESGSQALDICNRSSPDLIVSDWMMPEMNGLTFCQKFREIPRESYGYFILLTSKSEKDDIALGLDAGADDFLTKPVNAAELRARVLAGDRIVAMQKELSEKNRLVQSTLCELQKLYDSLDSDLLEAKKLQQSLVSERHKDLGNAQVSLLLQSSGHVGGDLVGYFPINDDQIGLYAIDVSGHGISSALMTARLAGYLSATSLDQNVSLVSNGDGSYSPRPPAETVADLNRMFLGEIETEHYFTLLLALVDLCDGVVTMTQAGHPFPSVQRADGTVEIVGTGGLPIGLVDCATYEQFRVKLDPGERLFIHSDGIDECASPEGVLLGHEGVEKNLTILKDIHGTALLEAFVWNLSSYAKKEEFDDDVSAIVLEFKETAKLV